MRNILKRLEILLMAAVIVCAVPVVVNAEEETGEAATKSTVTATGKCGDNLTWTIEDGVLTISGTGDMYDFYYSDNTAGSPWNEYGITKLVLEEGVTSIGAYAFYKCSGLTGDLVIPEGVTTIGTYSFCGCSGFTGGLVIPEGVTSIGGNAFSLCSGLTGDLVIPEGVTSIGAYAFQVCSGFTGNLIIPEGVTTIGTFSFGGCSGLTGRLVIPEGVTSIGSYAFIDCSGFTGDLIIPKGVTSIGSYAFSGCSGLTGDLIIPEGVTSIETSAFEDCKGFRGKLVLPERVTSIGWYAFSGCSGLTGDLIIPEGVTEIGGHAFSGCRGLTGDLIIPKGITKINVGTFFGCSGFTGDLVIPEGVTEIEDWAFIGCSGFRGELIIPKGVTEIEDSAFASCSGFKGELILPESVTLIGGDAFKGCNGINIVYFMGNAPTMGKDSFVGIQGALCYPSYKSGYEELTATHTQYTWLSYGEGETPWLNNSVSIKSFVERFYTVALNREADAAGVTNWSNVILANTCDATGLAKEFILGAEFKLRNLSNEEYIDVLYKTLFNREADATGKDFWLSVLESGQTREYVLANLIKQDEFKELCYSYGIERGVMFENGVAANPGVPQFVNRLYDKVMGRDADTEGLYNWVGALVVKAVTAEEAAVNFFNAKEYALKNTDSATYVTDLYNVFMDRDADADGLAFWVSCLDDYGVTRDWVISEFAKSAEFKAIAASYGLE